MKKSVLIITNIILAVLIIFLFFIKSSVHINLAKGFDGNSSNSGFIDNADVIINSDDINELIQKTSEELQMNIFIYIAGSSDYNRTDYQIECFADDYYDKYFGEDTDGILYYLDLSGHAPAYDYINTSGKAILLYQKNIDNIFTYLDYYLPASGQTIYSEDIETAIKTFLKLIEDYSSTNSINYYHDKSSGKYIFTDNNEFIISAHKPIKYNISFIVICFVTGVLTAIIVYISVKYRYKFKKSQNPLVYVKNEKTVFNKKSDMFIRTYTTKHKIQTNSGGSHGGHSGGSHSGGGHGGGGHHR